LTTLTTGAFTTGALATGVLVICVAGADEVPCANAGAVSMDAAISTAANVFNIVFFLLWRSGAMPICADAVDYDLRE
jgi:hypothetical protein